MQAMILSAIRWRRAGRRRGAKARPSESSAHIPARRGQSDGLQGIEAIAKADFGIDWIRPDAIAPDVVAGLGHVQARRR